VLYLRLHVKRNLNGGWNWGGLEESRNCSSFRYHCPGSKKHNLPGTKTPSGGELEAVIIVMLNENLRNSCGSLEINFYCDKLLYR
jgi:hypothetical protein